MTPNRSESKPVECLWWAWHSYSILKKTKKRIYYYKKMTDWLGSPRIGYVDRQKAETNNGEYYKSGAQNPLLSRNWPDADFVEIYLRSHGRGSCTKTGNPDRRPDRVS